MLELDDQVGRLQVLVRDVVTPAHLDGTQQLQQEALHHEGGGRGDLTLEDCERGRHTTMESHVEARIGHYSGHAIVRGKSVPPLNVV